MRSTVRPLYIWLCCLGILYSIAVSAPLRAQAMGGNNPGIEGQAGAEVVPEEDPVLRVLRERVDEYGQTVGIVAGIIRGINRYVYAYGTLNRGTIRRVSSMTVFEIGQLSSLYTTAMLSLLVQRGDVNLTDRVSAYLPETVNVPTTPAGRPILIEHLATHTSGLPRLPDNLVSTDPDDPLKEYSVELMSEFLTRYANAQRDWLETFFDFDDQSGDDPFESVVRYEYSDLGMGLLGHVLERASGESYDDLVRELLGDPIKLANTASVATLSMRTYEATGHDDTRRPVAPWSDTTLVGSTGLRSNLLDMMTLVSANMNIIYALPEDFTEDDSTRYHASFDDLIVPRKPADEPGVETALGWKVRKDERGRDVHWLAGRTNGFYAFAAFLKDWRKGVVVLSNSSASVEDIGFHLLSARNPLAPPPRKVARMNQAAYEACTGTYEFSPEYIVDITFSDGKLYGQPPGQPRSELVLESSGDFYLEEEDARITFVRDGMGNVSHFLFLQDGKTHRAERVW